MNKKFPILRPRLGDEIPNNQFPKFVPQEILKPYETIIQQTTNQTLDELAARDGLSIKEIYAYCNETPSLMIEQSDELKALEWILEEMKKYPEVDETYFLTENELKKETELDEEFLLSKFEKMRGN